MRIIGRILLALIIIVAIIIGGAYFLPKDIAVARSTVIDAPPDAIFPFLVDFRRFNEWQPWYGRDPDMVVEYEGAPSGVGAVMKWDSADPNVGTGRQEITAVEEFSSAESNIDFGPMGTATSRFTLEPADGATRVTWGFATDVGLNPIGRYMGLMMDRWVGRDYDSGLAKLKVLAETEAATRDPMTAGPATSSAPAATTAPSAAPATGEKALDE